MEQTEIKVGTSYQGKRWKGTRKVVAIERRLKQPALVHFLDERTQRTGNAELPQFAASADSISFAALYQAPAG